MTTSQQTPATEYLFAHSLLNAQLMRKIDQRLSYHGISFTEYAILRHLAESPGHTMRRIDLAQAIGITASGVTRILGPMEKIKLVVKEKNERDARVSLVKLSEAGASIFADATTSLDYATADLMSPLTENQLAKLMKYILKLI